MTEVKIPKKLIEVALPLDDINTAAAREKSIRHGHPSTLHLWWARRPLAAARAVIFAQMVNDPGYQRELGYGVNKREAEIKRERLFDIIRDLVKWENTNNEDVLRRAREAIWESWRETCHLNRAHPEAAQLFNPEVLPAFHDPFAGGGAIPLEAQRLGLESYASDLNPVAVMINKAMIEIPPKFAGRAPIGPMPEEDDQLELPREWSGAQGLAEDVRRYGHWMREEAFKRIGHLYPKVLITPEMVAERPDLEQYKGQELTVIAWLWARTVKSPNPAFSDVDVPLVSSFVLSSKKGKEAYIEPIISGSTYRFNIKVGSPPPLSKLGTKHNRATFKCILSETLISGDYIKAEGKEKRLGSRLLAIIAEGDRGRVYLPPIADIENLIQEIPITWKPKVEIARRMTGGNCTPYGLTTFGDLFTPRQLTALTTFSDLVQEAREKIIADAVSAGMVDDGLGIAQGGVGATAYGDALAVYLGFIIEQIANHSSSICGWNSTNAQMRNVFARQAIPMTWDYAESNIFCSSSGSFHSLFKRFVKGFESLTVAQYGFAKQSDASIQIISLHKVISTDPPYYDNIGYADLSDFFYVWMRRSLRKIYPDLFGTISVPKAEELVASPYRHGGRQQAETFFLDGMTQAMTNLAEQSHPAFPVTIYYAFKQSETTEDRTTSAGWVTFLEAVIQAGFSIDGTWPMRTEKPGRTIGNGSNALASSIILVCRKRLPNSETITRRQFVRELKEKMPEALNAMIGGETGHTPIAPVDLAQSSIGPGMAIFSKYQEILNQDGTRLSVGDALILINKAISEHLDPNGGSFEADTLFCNDWFAQHGWSTGLFGEADTLARAKGTSVAGVDDAGVIQSGEGKVRLLKWPEYPQEWDPRKDHRVPIWEACHHLIRVLNQKGESAAGALLALMPEKGEPIRQLAYHLYTLCERKGWAEDARAYNELISSWHGIVAASHEAGHINEQLTLL